MAFRVRLGVTVLVAIVAAWSCSRPVPAPVRVAPRAAVPVPSASVALAPATWQPGSRALANQSMMPRDAGEDGGLLFGGMRIALGPTGPVLATDVAEPALMGGQRMPAAWGGGFVFWSDNALFTSRTFLWELHPVVGARGRIAAISFGPTFALVRQANGDRWAWDQATGRRIALNPPGLVDIAAVPDGRAAAVLEGGRLLTSIDAGKTWRDSTAQAQPWPSGLQVEADGVWIATGAGGAVRLDKDGTLSEFASVPKPPPVQKDDRWTLRETPLERAVRRGIPLDEGTALVEAAGAMVKVDLRTGAIAEVSRRVLPPDMNCELMRTGARLLAACQGHGSWLVASGPLHGEPAVEKAFQSQGRFAAAGANLLFEGPCEGTERTPGVVCIRRGGTWTQLDASSSLAEPDAGPASRRPHAEVSRWIPGEEQGALGVVVRPVFGFLHARTGAFVECVKDCPAQQVDGLRTRAHDDVIDRTWVMTGEGSLRGWTRDGAATVLLDGHVMISPWRFQAVRGVGEQGVGWDGEGRLWQSGNRGESWQEVLGPPWKESSREMLCSDAGCQLGSWLRIGWKPEPPAPASRPQVARAPALAPRAMLPVLACVGTGEARVASRNPDENPTVDQEPGLGARLFTRAQGETMYFRVAYGLGPAHPILPADPTAFGYTALMHARAPRVVDGPAGVAPETAAELENAYTWWYAEPFDPALTVRSSTLRLRQLAEAAGADRQALLTLTNDNDRAAVPVLSASPGRVEGLLLAMEGGLSAWVRNNQRLPVTLLAAGAEHADSTEVVGAVATGADRVAVLAVASDGSERVLELERGRARTLFFLPPAPRPFQYPGNADALAIDGQGDIAVIRTPSGSEPAGREDPALLLRAAGPPVPLAPWATLTTADAPECANDPSGHRAILHTQQPWLDVRDANRQVADATGMIAMVRWNANRVCLEAVMVGAQAVEVRGDELATFYVTRFAGSRGSARIGLSFGREYRSGQQCTLRAAQPPGVQPGG